MMYKRAIWTYYFLAVCSGLADALTAAIYVSFLMLNGLNLFQVNMINLAFYLTRLVFEMPTGALADVWGKKRCYILAALINALALFVYGSSHTVTGFVTAEILCGLGSTLANGAFQAWIIQSQIEHKVKNKVNQSLGRERALRSLTLIFGGMFGAFLGRHNLSTPFLATSFTYLVIAVLASILMVEPKLEPRPIEGKPRSNWDSFQETVKFCVHLGKNHKTVKLILGLSFCLSAAMMGPNMQWQPWFSQFPYFQDKAHLGQIIAMIGIAVALGAFLAPKLVDKQGERQAMLSSLTTVSIGLLLAVGAKQLAFGLPGFLLHEAARGAFDPIQKSYLNQHANANDRATLLSMGSMPSHLGGILGLFLSGLLGHLGSIAVSWTASGLVLLVVLFWISRRIPA